MGRKYQNAIFDMDGTILDTLDDLANAVNYGLRENGFPERTKEEVRCFVGNGIKLTVERALPAGADEAAKEAVHASFREYYAAHCADCTRPYPGIVELLHTLRAKGCQTAVVSNKMDPAVQALCEQYFEGCFDYALGEKEGIRRKPAPDMVFAALEHLPGATRSNTVFIGDSEVDYATAKAAELDCIAVTYGFREREMLQGLGAKNFAADAKELESLIL